MSVLKCLDKARRAQNKSFHATHSTKNFSLIALHAEVTCAILAAQDADYKRRMKDWRRERPLQYFYYMKIYPKYTSYWHQGGWSWCFHTYKPEGECTSYTCTCGNTMTNFLVEPPYSWQDRVQRLLEKLTDYFDKL